MASTARMVLGGLLSGGGRGLMTWASNIREDALRRAAEMREDRQLRQERAHERELMDIQSERADARLDRQLEHQRDLTEFEAEQRRDLAGMDLEAQRERWDRADRVEVESQASSQIAALQERRNELLDMQRKGELLDPSAEGGVTQEMAQIQDQIRSIRARSMRQLREMGDPRYQDMGAREILISAGYSEDEIRERMPEPTSTSTSSPGASTAGTSTQPQGQPTSRGATAMEGPDAVSGASPQTEAPASPQGVRDLSKQGRGKRVDEQDLFDSGYGMGQPGLGDEIAAIGEALQNKPWIRREAARQQQGLESFDKIAAERVARALSSGQKPPRNEVMDLARKSPEELQQLGLDGNVIRRVYELALRANPIGP